VFERQCQYDKCVCVFVCLNVSVNTIKLDTITIYSSDLFAYFGVCFTCEKKWRGAWVGRERDIAREITGTYENVSE